MNEALTLNSNFGGSTEAFNLIATYAGDYNQNNAVSSPWYYPNYYYPIIERHYIETPMWTYMKEDKSKIEQAFKICKKLIEKKIIKVDKVKDFLDVVDEIVSIL